LPQHEQQYNATQLKIHKSSGRLPEQAWAQQAAGNLMKNKEKNKHTLQKNKHILRDAENTKSHLQQ